MGATKRVLEYLASLNMSKYEFYKRTGLSNGFLDKSQNIVSDKCERISKAFPNLNLVWLITGEGKRELKPYIEQEKLKIVDEPEPNIYKSKKAKGTELYKSKKVKDAEADKIPLFEFKNSVALTQLLDQPKVLSYIEIPNLPKCDGAIAVIGDSMYPVLKSGDIVIYKWVNDLKTGIIFGEVYILSVLIDNNLQTLFKLVNKSELEDHVQLASYDSQMASMDVHYNDIEAVALVKASIRYNTMS